ncbi:hypothetical protein ASPZODRAFT_157591 [Penicilliopsis zonata CBS 506.65]|uniref:DNA 3'-5' helicase n=1 Tax=Penicilliopsis zonata CBS 506.65 TaxID=1073090 RepID=A0A1L9SPF2_9EURO|nr:hypothetical protein ASPZODRAFT_157591 [Penicilliopsis zonata CBS 506.65]OJJ49132.1 hypothetical protein ASPZODRAFT_157591 [Penicilliopsis zonata CBS 506.65]
MGREFRSLFFDSYRNVPRLPKEDSTKSTLRSGPTQSSSQSSGLGSREETAGAFNRQMGGLKSLSRCPDELQLDAFVFKDFPVSVRGVILVSVEELPERFRSMFGFPLFNAVQSKCFQSVFNTNDNLVLAAPTGSGKTVVLELAICRLVHCFKDERFKVVYQAPTKSLCSERFRDWNRKFDKLGLQCAELTGDTDHASLRGIQHSHIIITTPEKWDSMTRKWKDHARLMQLVKLFLIDEVHILKEARGATLEAVVSRMKTIGSSVRFIALSATVPNSQDLAIWLGRDAANQQLPARREHFGEEFRPVQLQKFVYGYQSAGNDFAFDKLCGTRLPDVLSAHSCKKPVMIFCSTRNSSVATAKDLARLWTSTNPPARLWKGPSKHVEVHHVDLRSVAFHHAGLDPADRHTVETGFLQGDISIICCTSTLAVGVNLPCHLVIIKNTVGWQEGGCKEYSDLEMMQMLGRAGRPQFDDSATAVILTRKQRVDHYERLVSGTESIESCLHMNLIDHLNAEIGLGNVTSIDSAIRWLAGTFLFVRLRRNPAHYNLREGSNNQDHEDEMLRQICEKDIKLLEDTGLIASGDTLVKATPFGDAMARYYVRFETMKTLLSLREHARISEMLSAIAEAEEFREIRLKAGEKSLYKELNRAHGIRFPIKVDVALPAHKISLLIQSELGAVDFPDSEQFQKHKFSFQQDKVFVFSHINRLIRCVVDCQISSQDSLAVRNSLELARSFAARVWDNSPLQMKQIDQIGIVTVRKLAAAGIASIEMLESTEPHRIEMILSKNPPFGIKLLARLNEFPKLRVTTKMIGKNMKAGSPVQIKFKAEVAFMNEQPPSFFQRRPVYVCFLAETSDGRMVDFRRISASKLQAGHEVLLNAELNNASEYICCYAMCDDIAGTLRYAEVHHDLPASAFPFSRTGQIVDKEDRPQMNTSRPRSSDMATHRKRSLKEAEAFDGDDLVFDDFATAGLTTLSRYTAFNFPLTYSTARDSNWIQIDDSSTSISSPTRALNPPRTDSNKRQDDNVDHRDDESEQTRLENGKWACNHKCKDKTVCKHFCCRDGLDKPPKQSKKRHLSGQLTLPASITKKNEHEAYPIGQPASQRSPSQSGGSSLATEVTVQ